MIKALSMRKVLFGFAVLLLASSAFTLRAHGAGQEGAPAAGEKELEGRARALVDTNRLFLKAAKRFEAKQRSDEAAAYIIKAEEASGRAAARMKKRDYKAAIEDFSVSTHYAIQAIVIYKNLQGVAMREAALKEQADVKAGRDPKTKADLLEKRLLEAETFMQAAEKLLKEGEVPQAREKLKAAQDLYTSARTSRASGLNDLALENATKAYRLATEIVREIKIARAEVITFPRPRAGDDLGVYNYEFRRNDAYSYFASQIITDPDRETKRLLRLAGDRKDEAAKASNSGDLKGAAEALKDSTNLYMEAVKGSVK